MNTQLLRRESRHPIRHLPAVAVALAAISCVALSAVGCTPSAAVRESGNRELAASASPATPTPPAADGDVGFADGDVGFAEGDALPVGTEIGWADGLVADPGWSIVPSEHPGRWSYLSASGGCTASFRGGILGDAGGMDDAEATDALIEHQAGADFIGQEFVSDGRFLRYEHDDAGVAHRQFSYTVNELGYFMAARAFVRADYAVWVIVTCEGEPVGPIAQEVLSKNLIAVDAPED